MKFLLIAFSFALNVDCKPVEIETVICDLLEMDGIFPPDRLNLIGLNNLENIHNELINSVSKGIENKLPFCSVVLDNEFLDLTHIGDSCLRDQVKQLVEVYRSAKEPKNTDLRLNVVLKDDIPVSRRSRRISNRGPYKVVKKNPPDLYKVEKVGCHEGPATTSTAADNMKLCVRRSSYANGRVLWEIPTAPTDGAVADMSRYYTIGRERDALRFVSRRLQLTFSSREEGILGKCKC
ncbi:transposon Tf2-6 polyprotein [Nephila pilipes]|uniref:Transposon Tf2-6 polyprotein n=1 Tax=Nephila pilipes TaxID=299642 RepID=A0A8X6PC22_NEPPI|nr:transposon Tf2-6 polyprotein [Nephila pilipes]